MFKSAGLAKIFAGRKKFFRGPHAARMFVTSSPNHDQSNKNFFDQRVSFPYF